MFSEFQIPKIESFSMQLLQEPITFHAQGCFNLDFGILADVWHAFIFYFSL